MRALLVCLMLGAGLLGGCVSAPHLSTAAMMPFDDQTDFVTEDLDDGFVLTIARRGPLWTDVDTQVAIASCHAMLGEVARAVGTARGRPVIVVPGTVRLSLDHDRWFGRILCGAAAAVRYTDPKTG